MARPYVITWVQPDENSICAAQNVVDGEALSFTTNQFTTNIFTGVTTGVFTMPFGNIRTLRFSSGEDFAAVNFTIIGADENGNMYDPEVVAGPNAGEVESVNYYYTVYSITPDAALAENISVGYGRAGATFWYELDVWNKGSGVSMAYSNFVGGGAVSVTPQFSQTPQCSLVNGQPVCMLNTAMPALVVPMADLVSEPAPYAIPITEVGAFTFNNFPVVALNTSVGVATTDGFTQTIVQQGGKY